MSNLSTVKDVEVVLPSIEQLCRAWQEVIEGNHCFLVICHAYPDGDALGSLTAVGGFLQEQGKVYTLVVEDGMDNRFGYLPQADCVVSRPDAEMVYDVVIIVDCSDLQRIGRIVALLPHPCPPILQIDHHITNIFFGTHNLVALVASTCELLFELFVSMTEKISHGIAMSLLTGIVTDTLGFRTPNVTPRTLEVASQLMSSGANLPLITMNALNLLPIKMLELWRVLLNNLRFEEGLVWSTVSLKERYQIGVGSKDTAGLNSILGNVEEATMSAIFSEIKSQHVVVSFRSRPNFNVAKIAFALGGGGHPQASGCTFFGTLQDAIDKIVPLCKAEIDLYFSSKQ